MNDLPIKIDPEKAKNAFVTADYHIKDQEYDQALVILDKIANELDPTNKKAYFMAADIFLTTHEPEKTLEALGRIKDQPVLDDPLSLTEDGIRFLLLKSKALFLLKKYEECKKFLKVVLEKDHGNLEAVELQADLALEAGRTGEAIRIYESLHNRDYSVDHMLFSLASAHYRNNDPAMAYWYLKELDQVIKRSNPSVDSLTKLVQKELYKVVIEPDKSFSWLNKFLMKNLPWLAIEKINAHVNRVVDQQRLKNKLYEDKLSGCFNKDGIDLIMPQRYHESKKQFFVSAIDIDHFKSINECAGHAVGDEVIKAFGKISLEHFPLNSFRGGKGADEFFWTFDGTEAEAIERAIIFRKDIEKRVRELVNSELKEKPLRDSEDKPIFLQWNITCSQGLTEWKKGMDAIKVKNDADGLLRETKAQGRNSIIYKMKAIDKGDRPIEYMPVLLKHLNQAALKAGFSDWWKWKEKLSPEGLRAAIDQAGRQSDEEKRLAISSQIQKG